MDRSDRTDGSANASNAASNGSSDLHLNIPLRNQGRSRRNNRGNRRSRKPEKTSAASMRTPPTHELTEIDKIIHAIQTNDMNQFQLLLKSDKVNVEEESSNGDTLLGEACRYARVDMVKLLVTDHHADVNKYSSLMGYAARKAPPIVLAIITLNEEVVELLLSADPKQSVDLMSFKAWNWSVLVPIVYFSRYVGHTADQNDHANRILERLLQYAEDTDQLEDLVQMKFSDGSTLLHLAAQMMQPTMVQLLIAKGAKADEQDESGKTPLLMLDQASLKRKKMTNPLAIGISNMFNKDQKVPECEAEKQLKQMNGKKASNEDDNELLKQTLLALTPSLGVSVVMEKTVRNVFIKGLILSHFTIPVIANEICALPLAHEIKDDRLGGMIKAVTKLQNKYATGKPAFQTLWLSALRMAPPETKNKKKKQSADVQKDGQLEPLTPDALAMVFNELLRTRSLPRQVKVWTMVLLRLLSCPDAETDSIYTSGKFEHLMRAIYEAGVKLMFYIFDRTHVEDDESYEEDLEIDMIVALMGLFLQLLPSYLSTLSDPKEISKTFDQIVRPVEDLWPLLEAGLDVLRSSNLSPQRFTLLIHTLQITSQLRAAFKSKHAKKSIAKLNSIVDQLRGQMRKKTSSDEDEVSQLRVFHRVAQSFLPLPRDFVNHIENIKYALDLLLRSDPKLLGMDLYALARVEGLVRLEHKVDYLGLLAEESRYGFSLTVSRASAASLVDFIANQILAAKPRSLRAETNVSLLNEPGVGVGVLREFFLIVQTCFFRTLPFPSTKEAETKSSLQIHRQWATADKSEESVGETSSAELIKQMKEGKRVSWTSMDTYLPHFPLFAYCFDDPERHEQVRVTPWNLVVSKGTDTTSPTFVLKKEQCLQDDMNQRKSRELMYRCVGRLIGLAIRNHQPLNVLLPIAFWKFVLQERITWQEYCANDTQLIDSLQHVLDFDFDKDDLDLTFTYASKVDIVDKDRKIGEKTVDIELKSGFGDTPVTNATKKDYVELRAKQHFFRHEYECYKKMKDGLLESIPKSDLALFTPRELQKIALGSREIDFVVLKDLVVTPLASQVIVGRFWDVVEQFEQTKRRMLLTFWSGSPQPPLFGFGSGPGHRALNADSSEWFLEVDTTLRKESCPMANTCERRLILPPYDSKETLQEKLEIALEHGAVGYDRM